MPLIIPANTLSAAAYSVDNSCRFNIADGAEMAKTLSTPTDRDKWTFSAWIKLGSLGEHGLFDCHEDASNYTWIGFGSNGTYTLYSHLSGSASANLTSTRRLRDFSAWFHMQIVWDSGNATAGDRVIIYINGVRETAFGTETYPAQDANSTINSANPHGLARKDSNDGHNYDGYMAEVVFIDGQSLTPTSFGEFDEDSPTIWKPKKVSGLTFGNNGFYLDFADSADLGDDESGNTNDFTETNLTAADQCTDSPTNNFCVMNPLDNYYYGSTFSEGNCKVAGGVSTYAMNTGTFWLTKGKWYWELQNSGTTTYNYVGITAQPSDGNGTPGEDNASYGIRYDGNINHNGGTTAHGGTYGASVVGIYLDLDNNKFNFAIDGTIQNSGTGYSLTAASAIGYYNAYSPVVSDSDTSNTYIWNMNFGGCPAFAISSGNTDANGYGNFEYDPSSGTFDGGSKDYLAICSKNLGSDGG